MMSSNRKMLKDCSASTSRVVRQDRVFNKHNLELIPRKCLKCRRPFQALGRHNRICQNCRVSNIKGSGLPWTI